MKYRLAIQVAGAVSGLVTPDLPFVTMILDKLIGKPGIEWLSLEASSTGVFSPLEEGTAVIRTEGEPFPGQLELWVSEGEVLCQ